LDDWRVIFERAAAVAPKVKVTIYFVSFIVFGTMIVLNLFIGIILNGMAETHAEIERQQATASDPDLAAIEQQLAALQTAVRRLRQARERTTRPPTD
jgi:voltage-gated sodium channel